MPRQHQLCWELGSALYENYDATHTVSSAEVHLDGNGNGGARSGLNTGALATIYSPSFKHGPSAEFWERGFFWLNTTSSEFRIVWRSSSTVLGSIRVESSDNKIRIYTGTATLEATSATALNNMQWYQVEVHVFIDDTNGFIRVYIDDDGSYDTPFVEFGPDDTKPGSAPRVNNTGVALATTCYHDDGACHTIGLEYDNGVGGAPAIGETITDAITGGTCVVEAVNGDATSGFVVVSQVSGTFGNNNQITSTGTFDASVNAPHSGYVSGLMPLSGAPGPEFLKFLVPTAAGTYTQLTPDSGSNWQMVDDVPIDASGDKVSGASDGLQDTYTKGTIGTNPGRIVSVTTVVSARRDGAVINNMQHVLRYDGSDYDDDNSILNGTVALPVSYDETFHNWHDRPDHSAPWSFADVEDSGTEPGVRVLT